MKQVNQSRLLLGLLCLLLSGFSSQAQEITKSFSGITKIVLNTVSGNCKLIKGNNSEVKVTISYTYSPHDYKPILENREGTLYLKEEFIGKGSFSGKSEWTLSIPENLYVTFSTGSGKFEVGEISVDLAINSGSGDFKSVGVNGQSKIVSGSGNVTVWNGKGAVNAMTGSGTVSIANLDGKINVTAGSGDINFENLKGSIFASAGSGEIIATGIELTGDGSFNSGSGDATVVLKTSPKSNIAVDSGSGDATLEFNGSKIEGIVILTANKEGKIYAPFPFDKTEELVNNNNQLRIRKTAKLGSGNVEVRVSTGSGRAKIKQ